MIIKQTSNPSLFPVELTEAKDALRVDFNTEDVLLDFYITVATGLVEGYIHRDIIQRTYTAYADCFLNKMELTADLQSVSAIRYQDSDDAQQTLATSVYKVDPHSLVGAVRLAYGQSWPSTYNESNVVEIDFTAGLAADSESTPSEIKQAILLLVGTMFDHRDSLIDEKMTGELPFPVKMALNPYRIVNLG